MPSRASRRSTVLSLMASGMADTWMEMEVRNPPDGDIERWRRRITSTPSRVVKAVRLGYDASGVPNAWGDTPSDFYAVTTAIGRAGMERQHDWPLLVDAGVIDEICNLVIYMQSPPIQDARERPPEEIASVYIRPFSILCAITKGFPRPLTRCDSKVIASIKAHWSQMMLRLWEDPQNTLNTLPNFTQERIIASSVMVDVSIADPTFISIVEKKSDKTVQVFARHMVHSTSILDAWSSSGALTNICHPFVNEISSYRNKNPLPPHIFHRIMLGAGSPLNLVSAFSSHLDRLWGFDAEMCLLLFESLLDIVAERTHPAHAEFVRAVRESGTFWFSVISLLRRSVTDDQLDSHGELNGSSLSPKITSLLAWFILDVTKRHQSKEESFGLVKTWTDYDIFGALEDLITHTGPSDVLMRDLCALFMGIADSVKQNPTLAPFIRRMLPRQNMSTVLTNWVRVATKDAFHHGCAIFFNDIHCLCILKDECFRRGCNQKCRARCGRCEGVIYCGQECQKLDWNEHKVTCKRISEWKLKHPLRGASTV